MKKELLLILSALTSFSTHAQTIGDTGKEQVTIIEPKKKNKVIKGAAIDDERFEVGAYLGMISIEDFNTVSIMGLTGSYHLNDSWVLSTAYGKSSAPRASFEDILDEDFLQDRDEGFQYLAFLGSYELFEGRSFYGEKKKFSSHLYLDVGIENVTFAGETQTGFVIGTSYKMVFKDWLTGDMRMRDHIVNRSNFLRDEKLTQNIELTFSVSALF